MGDLQSYRDRFSLVDRARVPWAESVAHLSVRIPAGGLFLANCLRVHVSAHRPAALSREHVVPVDVWSQDRG